MLAETLTEKRKMFCHEYVSDFDAKRAALAVGYSEHSAAMIGYKLLKEPQIAEYVNFLKAERNVQTKLNKEYVINSIIEVLERAKGTTEIELIQDPNDDEADPVVKIKEFKPDPKSALKAAELLGKHLALFTDVIDNRMTFTQMPEVKIGSGAGEGDMKALTFEVGSEPNDPDRSIPKH